MFIFHAFSSSVLYSASEGCFYVFLQIIFVSILLRLQLAFFISPIMLFQSTSSHPPFIHILHPSTFFCNFSLLKHLILLFPSLILISRFPLDPLAWIIFFFFFSNFIDYFSQYLYQHLFSIFLQGGNNRSQNSPKAPKTTCLNICLFIGGIMLTE